jgi:hypothetical protein
LQYHRRVRSLLIAAAVLVPLATALPASGDTEACARAYEHAQTARRDAKLLESRRELVTCAQDQCPAVLRKDCATWLSQLEETIPRLSVHVKGRDGCDRADARVWVDDLEIENGANGLPIEVNPGARTVRVSLDGITANRSVVVSTGERDHMVPITFAADNAKCGAAPAPATRPPAPADRPMPERTPPKTLTYVLAGVGAASAIVGAAFGVSAWSQKSVLDDCKGACAQRDVDTMRRTFLVADLGGGIAVLSLAAAATLYFLVR